MPTALGNNFLLDDLLKSVRDLAATEIVNTLVIKNITHDIRSSVSQARMLVRDFGDFASRRRLKPAPAREVRLDQSFLSQKRPPPREREIDFV